MPRAILAAAALALALAVPALRPASAQFDLDPGDPNRPGKPEQPPQTCTETLDRDQSLPGVLSISVTSPCRRDVPLIFNVEVGDPSHTVLTFHTVFNSEGHAEAILPLFQTNKITWLDAGGNEMPIKDVTFKDYDRTVQIVLVWDDPIDLDLRLVEPKGPPSGNVYAGKPNTDFSNGYGVLARADDGQADGTHAEIYVLPSDHNPVLKGTLKNGVIAQKIEFITRDMVRKSPYCDGGEFSAPTFTIYQNVYGRLQSTKLHFSALACAAIPENDNRLFGGGKPVLLQPPRS